MELMTKVQSEQHNSRELLCRLGQQDEEIKQLKENVSHLVRENRYCEWYKKGQQACHVSIMYNAF